MNGKCRHGKLGRSVVNGKTCEYSHPKTCKSFEKFGYKAGGCQSGDGCEYGLHLTLCKQFMRGQCDREVCRFFHPRKLHTRIINSESALTMGKSHSPTQNVKWNLPRSRIAPWARHQDATAHDNNNNPDQSFLEVTKAVEKILDRYQAIALRKH